MADDDCCGVDEEQIRSPGYRRALWIVVALNVGYGVIELFGGFMANSQALKADALDFLGDGSITFLGLLAIGWSLAWRARSAFIQGIFLGLLGLWVLASTVLKTLTDTPVEAGLRAVWLFSRNDAIGNVAVIIAAGLVALTSTRWPDLIVAFLIAALFLHSAWNILRDARRDLSVVTSRKTDPLASEANPE